MEISLPVGLVGWSQDSISGTFRDGRDIQATINALRGGTNEQRRAFLATFPPIRVVYFVGQGWITLDNRRLYVFRTLLLPGTLMTMRVATIGEAQELRRKLTNRYGGANIVFRCKLEQCFNRY